MVSNGTNQKNIHHKIIKKKDDKNSKINIEFNQFFFVYGNFWRTKQQKLGK
jgi:hypothetical protein